LLTPRPQARITPSSRSLVNAGAAPAIASAKRSRHAGPCGSSAASWINTTSSRGRPRRIKLCSIERNAPSAE
jgi:hypothetical protein